MWITLEYVVTTKFKFYILAIKKSMNDLSCHSMH